MVVLKTSQLSIARTVIGAHKGTSHDFIYNELNWPFLADRTKGVKLKEFSIRLVNDETPVFIRSLLPNQDRGCICSHST